MDCKDKNQKEEKILISKEELKKLIVEVFIEDILSNGKIMKALRNFF